MKEYIIICRLISCIKYSETTTHDRESVNTVERLQACHDSIKSGHNDVEEKCGWSLLDNVPSLLLKLEILIGDFY